MSEVRNNEERHRFELEVEGHVAHADYRVDGDTITFTHTIVPPALQGQGAGSRLIAAALAAARANGWRVVPQCPFVAAYIAKHPEWRDLLA